MDFLNESNLLTTIVYNNYIRQFKLSNSIRPKYYRKSDKLPEKYLTSEYQFVKLATLKYPILVHMPTKTRVVKNPKKVGQPNMKNINGQDIYNNNLFGNARNLLMGSIHKEFITLLKTHPPLKEFPIIIEMEIHDVVRSSLSKNMLWDATNRALPYGKAFEDVLKICKIIPDDNVLYVTGPPRPIFCPIDKEEDRKLVFKIYKDTREIIKNHYEYNGNKESDLNFLNKNK